MGGVPRQKRFSYSEVACFKYFGWCQKGNSRYKSYLRHQSIYKSRLDVKNLIINQGDVGTLSTLVMKPFQAKVASKLDLHESQDEVSNTSKSLKIEDALTKLEESGPQKQQLCHKERIDSYLRELVDKQMRTSALPKDTAHIPNSNEDDFNVSRKTSADPKGKNTKNLATVPAKPDRAKKPASKRTAPFDPFGITPQFYIKGETETTSWVGCFCTLIEITVTLLVVIFFTRSFFRKENVDITILNVKSNESPFIDLKQNRQILVLNHYLFNINPETLFPTKAYYVEKDAIKGTTVKTPLEIKLCTEIKSDYSDLNLKL